VGDIDRGTSLSLISQFPGEDEILVPPFSYVEVTGDSFVMKTKKGKVTVYPARINCNLKSQTIEEIQSRRQTDLVAMAPYLELERKRDHAPVLVALDEMLAVKSDEAREMHAARVKQIDLDRAKLWKNLETHEAAWCNNDNNYSEALSGAIAFKFFSLYKLINAAYDYKEDASTLIELARTGEHKMLSILASVGEDFRAATNFRDKEGNTILMAACANKHAAVAEILMPAITNA